MLDNYLALHSALVLEQSDNLNLDVRSDPEKYIAKLKAKFGSQASSRIKWSELAAAVESAGIFQIPPAMCTFPAHGNWQHDESAEPTEVTADAAPTEAELMATQVELEETTAELEATQTELEDTASTLVETETELKNTKAMLAIKQAEFDQLSAQMACAICWSAQKTALLLPCKHLCCCAECAPGQIERGRCPICAQAVVAHTEVYLS
ncbi:RING-HC finger protein [bacterium]|nr:RING-HC finger protein [bacterium]